MTPFSGPDAPSLDEIRKCVHCGICLPQCPTYRVLGEEMDSPRGRLYLMRAALEGRIEPTETFAQHFDLCPGCRACETACPSDVPFGNLLEATRATIGERAQPLRRRMFASLVFAVFPHPSRVGLALRALRLYQRLGLQRVVAATGILRFFPGLAAMASLIASVPETEAIPELIPAQDQRRGRVGLLTGCVQRHLYSGVNRDTAQILSLAGYDVVVPRAQGCCGALELHGGRLAQFRERARALVGTFPRDLDWIVVNAAGCGSAMKEYGHWVAGSPDVERFAGRTRDVSEILATADLPLGRLDVTVTYHDACHLAHGQRIRNEPRALLRRIPGLRLVELADSDLCCGSAGVYNLFEPDVADQLLERKVDRIVETGARIVATGNPGCLLQIAKGARLRGVDLEVVHPVELLARAARVAGDRVAVRESGVAAGGGESPR